MERRESDCLCFRVGLGLLIAGLLLFLFEVKASPQNFSAHYQHDGQYALPDAKVTPGAVNHQLVADPSGKPHKVNGVEANLCAKDFRTGPYRKTSESTKKAACAEYGAQQCPGSKWEVDHLISLEIGGADELANLWPQPIQQAREKDHGTEDVLPKLLCAGKISLPDAQKCISGDWVKCAARVKSLEGQ